jgi:hypothetical protein
MPVFSFGPTTEIAVVACIGDGRSRDWLGIVMRDAPDQSWYSRYRFRYYDGGDLNDPDAPDTKQVFESRPNDMAPDGLVRSLRSMIATLHDNGFGDDIEIHEIYGDAKRFQQVIASGHSKFFHSWQLPNDGKPRGPSKYNV